MNSMNSMNSIARMYAQILGTILLLAGVFGWIPALTPGGLFLGLFALNPVHNLVHLLTGLVGLCAGLLLPDRSVRLYTLTMTIVYGLVAFIGYVHASALGVLAINLPDTLLHTAIFVLSLLVVLAAFSEQGFLVRHAQLAASLLPRARQERADALDFAATPLQAPRWSEQRQAADMANATAALREHLRRLERDVAKIGPMAERQETLEQELRRLRREVEMLRAAVQALTQGQQASHLPATSRPGSWPSLGVESDAGAWPYE